MTADRGYGYAAVEADLHHLETPPRRDSACGVKPSAARRELEHRKAFRTKVNGEPAAKAESTRCERGYGWNRTELTTLAGARTWCGPRVFAHNLVKISALAG